MELGKLIDLPKIADPRGNLTFAEAAHHIPFEFKRAYWTYDVPSGEHRGGHAHRDCKEFIVALSGSFTVTLDDGKQKTSYLLNHPYQGLLVDNKIWRTLEDFSSGAVCMVLAENYFDEDDYIREYEEFLTFIK